MNTENDFRRLMGRLRLRHLALLDLLGKDPNVGRAAKTMHMAQPTASKLLREIEDIFETVLFTRNRRGLTPTPAGKVLARRASILLAEIQATHTELRSALNGGTGHLRLGVFPVGVTEVLPQLYAALQNKWPGLTIEIEEAVETRLLDQLSEGKIDCILGRIVMENLTPDLRHEALYNEPTVIVCSTRHPLLAANAQERVQILRNTHWMLPARHGAVYNMVASKLAALGIKAPQVEVETTSVFVTIELLNHTTLLSILPKKVALAYAELNKVALAPQGDLESNYPVGIMYRAEALSNPIINLVLETVRAMSGSIAADHPPA
ncbi:LysR family transcriptional regulator [Neopusillimonas maritima]|uniref:HTH lysR-type domain-containing protein n=1 Tax=Neopusillimonas maritima TaxID=2026239 RepID=A0A3A1YWC7_9BURK|nr:LysR family transcriptional regulator [Neopusillimonas maritima]RIY40357.1 hypothetical protein CJP73_10850 [Neopusillimonas maritima]